MTSSLDPNKSNTKFKTTWSAYSANLKSLNDLKNSNKIIMMPGGLNDPAGDILVLDDQEDKV
jgi:hypothetical protein